MSNWVTQMLQNFVNNASEEVKQEVRRLREALYGTDNVVDSTAVTIDEEIKALPAPDGVK